MRRNIPSEWRAYNTRMKALVIAARGLRLDYVGCYGNPWIETPALDALAARGAVFDQHFAAGIEREAADHVWRTGRYATAEGPATSTSAPDLIAFLNAHGVATSLVVDGSWPGPRAFAEGWQTVDHVTAAAQDKPLECAIQVAQRALRALTARTDWLLWVDLATALPPWNVPAEFATHYFREEAAAAADENDEEAEVEVEPLTPLPDPALGPVDADDDTLYLRLQGSYAAAVTYLDAGIAELLGAVPGDVLVVVTSDAGFALGEHGQVGPGSKWPWQTLAHVPLLLRLPGGAAAGRRVSALTLSVDLAPTLAGLFGLALPEVHGQNLIPLLQGDVETIRPYAVSWLPAEGGKSVALRTPEWSLLRSADDGAIRLHVRPDDRWEVNDVRQHHLELTEALERTMQAFLDAAGNPGPLLPPALELRD